MGHLHQQPSLKQRLAAREMPLKRDVMLHNWRNVLFMHWSVPAVEIQKRLPKNLFVDTYRDQAFVSLVSLYLKDVKFSLLKSFDGLNFPGLHYRTYVYDEKGEPGIWFFSVEEGNRLGALAAAHVFSMPAVYSQLKLSEEELTHRIHVENDSRKPKAELIYIIGEPTHPAEPGSLEFFLLERYIVFAEKRGRVVSAKVNHHPFSIFDAVLEKWDAHMAPENSLIPERKPDLVHFSKGVDVTIYSF